MEPAGCSRREHISLSGRIQAGFPKENSLDENHNDIPDECEATPAFLYDFEASEDGLGAPGGKARFAARSSPAPRTETSRCQSARSQERPGRRSAAHSGDGLQVSPRVPRRTGVRAVSREVGASGLRFLRG